MLKLFIGTPIRQRAAVCGDYTLGYDSLLRHFGLDQVMPPSIEISSYLPKQRDSLASRFYRSDATHLLWIDSDIKFGAVHVQALLDTGKDFVSGAYARKTTERQIPAKFTGVREGDNGILWEATHVAGGFLLLTRACVTKMIKTYAHLAYPHTELGTAWALWQSEFKHGAPDPYVSEDISFCQRWRAIGGQIWLHAGVILGHIGELVYELPTTSTEG